MGLHELLKGHEENTSGRSQSAIAEETSEVVAPFPAIPVGSTLSVIAEHGDFALCGKVEDCSDEVLSIRPLDFSDCQAVIPPNCTVYVQGYKEDLTTLNFSAVVLDSHVHLLRVCNPKVISHIEGRGAFRLPVDVIATYSVGAGPERECQMINISSTGACFVAQAPYLKGTITIYLRLIPERYTRSIRARVIRKVPRGAEGWEYGVTFRDMDEIEAFTLYPTLQEIRSHLQSEGGAIF